MAYSPIKKDGTPKKKPGRKPIPREPSTFVRSAPRPHIWVTGPDVKTHNIYIAWGKAKAQANFRGEEWTLTSDEYHKLWFDLWEQRGRKPEDYCMTRITATGPWSTANVEILTRKEHLQRQGYNRKGKIRYNKMKVTQ